VNKSVQIKATAAAKRARVEEGGLRGPRLGKISARTRKAQARRDAKADGVITPAEMTKRKFAAGPGASNVAAKKPTADAGARKRRTSPLIEVRTANSVEGSAGLDAFAEEIVTGALSRFMPRVTRIDVHLSDANADRKGDNDKRCQIEVRPASQQPVSATATAGTIEKALASAASKMKRLLAKQLGRAQSRTGHRGLVGDA
jgi:ribosome-associated translation inhibitor RaiA